MNISLSKRTRASVSKAFKVASKYLAKSDSERHVNKTKYTNICACLSHAYRKGEVTKQITRIAQEILMSRLNDEVYFDDWIVQKIGHPAYDEDRLQNDGRKKQDARRRWLQSLIKEFSE